MQLRLARFPGNLSGEELSNWRKEARNIIPRDMFNTTLESYDEEEFLVALKSIDGSLEAHDLVCYHIGVDTLGLVPSSQQLSNLVEGMSESCLRLKSVKIDCYGKSHGDVWWCKLEVVGPRLVSEVNSEIKAIGPDGKQVPAKATYTQDELNLAISEGAFYESFNRDIILLLTLLGLNGLNPEFPVRFPLSENNILKGAEVELKKGIWATPNFRPYYTLDGSIPGIDPDSIIYRNSLRRLSEYPGTYLEIINSFHDYKPDIFNHNSLVGVLIRSEFRKARVRAAALLSESLFDSGGLPMTPMASLAISNAIQAADTTEEAVELIQALDLIGEDLAGKELRAIMGSGANWHLKAEAGKLLWKRGDLDLDDLWNLYNVIDRDLIEVKGGLIDFMIENSPQTFLSNLFKKSVEEDLHSIDSHTLSKVHDLLSRVDSDPDAFVSLLTRCVVKHPRSDVKRESVKILGAIGGTRAKEFLMHELKNNSDEDIRTECIDSLISVLGSEWPSGRGSGEFRDLLYELAGEDTCYWTKIHTFHAIRGSRDIRPDALIDIIKKLNDLDLLHDALITLGRGVRMGVITEEHIDFLCELIKDPTEKGKTPHLRVNALTILRKGVSAGVTSWEHIEFLCELINDAGKREKEEIFLIFGAIADNGNLPLTIENVIMDTAKDIQNEDWGMASEVILQSASLDKTPLLDVIKEMTSNVEKTLWITKILDAGPDDNVAPTMWEIAREEEWLPCRIIGLRYIMQHCGRDGQVYTGSLLEHEDANLVNRLVLAMAESGGLWAIEYLENTTFETRSGREFSHMAISKIRRRSKES